MGRCGAEEPQLRDIGGRIVACHLYDAAVAASRPAMPLEAVATGD